MKRVSNDIWLASGILIVVACWHALEALPTIAPTFAWRTRWSYLQEPAICHLMKRLYVGMTYEEMVAVMGKPNGGAGRVINKNGQEFYSYNVNFGFTRGIDISLQNGRVISIFEYD